MPQYQEDDTIAAIATPPGEGGIAIIRISGPSAFDAAAKIFTMKKPAVLRDFPSHTIHYGAIRNETGETLDQVLISLFKSPHSYTGEDVIEISTHGGLTVSHRILDLLIRTGLRHADPGEFTKRAFLNGKMDLTQAEGVLDLIKAKSDLSLNAAVRQLSGILSKRFKNIKNEMMKLYAHMEAFLDFPDEQLEIYSDQTIAEKLGFLIQEIKQLIATFTRGRMMREGVQAVIVGKPNVGKSSFFNMLLARDRALVSEYPGTTRDSLEEALEIGGLYLRLIDTAGLISDQTHPLDHMGMERTKKALQDAQVYLYLVDGSRPLDSADEKAFAELRDEVPFLVVINKSDLPGKIDKKNLEKLTGKHEFIFISSKTQEGLDLFENKMTDLLLQNKMESGGEQITRLRHKNALQSALDSLERADQAFREQRSLEFVTVDLKSAADSMSELIGEVYSEDLLDVIFSEFCIGK